MESLYCSETFFHSGHTGGETLSSGHSGETYKIARQIACRSWEPKEVNGKSRMAALALVENRTSHIFRYM